jgi:1-acyl-sn-glycerol-3-phosphate acyltransferase
MRAIDFLSAVSPVLPQSPVPENSVQHSPKFHRADRGSLIVRSSVLPFRRKPTVVGSPPLSQFTPWLIATAYPLGRYGVVPAYFQQVEVTGRHHLPLSGPMILAPTHRSRWDAIMVPFAAGHDITGRHLRFMVSANEVVGLQGWLIRHLGGFPVDTHRPAIATLRHGVELLQQGQTLVIFPEGDIFRQTVVQPLKPGLARIALQAQGNHTDLGVKIVPIHIRYSRPNVPWRCRVQIHIGAPLVASNYCLSSPKLSAQQLTTDLYHQLSSLGEC